MPGKINLYNVGSLGVDLTRSVHHAEDGSWRQLQNAVPDIRGEFGGVAKRDGLTALNASGVGSVTGVVPASLLGKGNANEGVRIFIGSEQENAGFFKTSLDFLQTVGGSEDYPADQTAIIPSDAFDDLATSIGHGRFGEQGHPGRAAGWNNQLFFVYGEDASPITDADPPIQIWTITGEDGGDHRFFTKIPINPDVGEESKGILTLLVNENYLYAGVWDTGTTSANVKGSVYRIDTATGSAVKLGATLPTGYLPTVLTWYQGKLWVGTYSDDTSFSGRVYWIRPGIDADWTLDHTTTAGQGEITALQSFKGKLYATTRGSSGKAALVKVRATDGTWSTALTGAATTADQYFLSLAVFNGFLYASYFKYAALDADRVATIHQSEDGATWTTVLTVPADSGSAPYRAPYMLFNAGENDYLFAMSASAQPGVYTSDDGTTWTNRTSIFGNVVQIRAFGSIGVG